MARFSDAELVELRDALWPMIAAAIVETVERADGRQPVTAHAGDIISVDGAVANVATADNPSATIPVTRATGATEGARCVVLFVQGGRAFALGSIPQVPNNTGPDA